MTISFPILINKELFLSELSICEHAIEQNNATGETLKRYRELIAIQNDPEAMALIDAQKWGSNREPSGDLRSN